MTPTLYDRLGAEKGITKLLDDAVNLHIANPMVSPKFLLYKDRPQQLMTIKEHTVHFFCTSAGGPQD